MEGGPDSIMHKFGENPRFRSLKNGIKGALQPKKPNITLLNRKDDYFRHYYFPISTCLAIEIEAFEKHIPLRAAAEYFMERGIRDVWGEKLAAYRDELFKGVPLGTAINHHRMINLIVQSAKKQGFDISIFL